MKWIAGVVVMGLGLGLAAPAYADDIDNEIAELYLELLDRKAELDNLANPTSDEQKESKRLALAIEHAAAFSVAHVASDWVHFKKMAKAIRKSKTVDPEVLPEASETIACLPAIVTELGSEAAAIAAVLGANKQASVNKLIAKADAVVAQGIALAGVNDKKAEAKLLKAVKKALKALGKAETLIGNQNNGGGGGGIPPQIIGLVQGDNNVNAMSNISGEKVYVRSFTYEFEVLVNGGFVTTVTGAASDHPNSIADEIKQYGFVGMAHGSTVAFGDMLLEVMLPFQPAQTIELEGVIRMVYARKEKKGPKFTIAFPVDTGPVPF